MSTDQKAPPPADTSFGKSVLSTVADIVRTSLPKFELHAHINGSIPLSVLQRFAEQDVEVEKKNNNKNYDGDGSAAEPSAAQRVVDDVRCFMTPLGPEATPSERMAHCFKVFDVVYKLMQNRQRLFEATSAVVRSFMEEGCIYVELRTTPKSLPDGTTDEQYIECVLDAIHDQQQVRAASSTTKSDAKEKNKMFTCNLLLSINRRGTPESATRVIDLAVAFRKKQAEKQKSLLSSANNNSPTLPTVVGIDFCGDCYARTFKEFIPALEKAKANQLPVTLHMGEKKDDEEVDQMVSFGPQRVGHCVFINPRAHEALRVRQVHLEICITSNMMTGGLDRPRDHHIVEWMQGGRHPVSINTDDFGVFSTTLEKELMLFAEICLELWCDANERRHLDDGNSGEEDDKKTKLSAIKWICAELWRVQFHAARAAFCLTEGERSALVDELSRTHEEVWRANHWW